MPKRRSKLKQRIAALMAAVILVLAVHWLLVQHYAVLDARGSIAERQRQLIIFATLLSLAVILPVFWLTFHIVHTYRVDAKKTAKYQPEWDGNRNLEALWWSIPTAIILVLSVVTWRTSHSLDPYKPLDSDRRPLTVQVIALQWKWLFLYPEQKVATVNYAPLPVDRPINFEITADAPMNSFWIPQLGGQIYAMTGMNSQLHLIADQTGDYRGSSANLSGSGFADMNFMAHVVNETDFDSWANSVRNGNGQPLDSTAYQSLAAPSKKTAPASFPLQDSSLYDTVMAKYMNHGAGH
jgi:cytochrome o ubiquinol oxidase subunit 2